MDIVRIFADDSCEMLVFSLRMRWKGVAKVKYGNLYSLMDIKNK